MHTVLTTAFVSGALAVLASAQSISSSCQSSLASIATNPDASACLAPSNLVSLFIGSQNTSIVNTVNSWLTSMCAAGSCSNDTIASVVTNVTTGCSAELSSSGYSTSGGDNSALIALVQQAYPTARQVLCLKESNGLCVTDTLNNIQSATGTTLSLSGIVSLASNSSLNLPSSVVCTNCVKEAYNLVNAQFGGLISPAKTSLQATCGSSFLDGTTPTAVSEIANSATASRASNSNAAMGAMLLGSQDALTGVAISALMVITTMFAFLA